MDIALLNVRITIQKNTVVVDLLNNRPRKTLDYLSPSEFLDNLGVALA